MTTKTWLGVLAIAALGMGIYLAKPAPDKRLAKQLAGICEIAKANGKSPSRGVDQLFAFLAARTPDLMRDFGELLVEIEQIGDDAKHDARAREASRRMRKPLESCAPALERFGQAISNDAEASKKLERGVDRLGRTLTLLFDSAALGSLRELRLPHAANR